MFKIKSLDEAFYATSDSRTTDTKYAVANECKQFMQQFNSLAENINNGMGKNNPIRFCTFIA